MDIKKLNLAGLDDEEVNDILIKFLAFQGFKKLIEASKEKTIVALFLKNNIPSRLWRSFLAGFIGMPWELDKLDDEDYLILKQVHEMLTV